MIIKNSLKTEIEKLNNKIDLIEKENINKKRKWIIKNRNKTKWNKNRRNNIKNKNIRKISLKWKIYKYKK